MVVIATLVLGTLGARLVGWLGIDDVDSWPEAIAVGLAAMFVLTGVAHFVPPMRRDMIAIVPPLLMLVMFPANVYAARMPNPPKSMTSRLDIRTVEEIVYLGAAVVVCLGSIQ